MIESITFVWEYMRDEEKKRIIDLYKAKVTYFLGTKANKWILQYFFFVYLWFAQTNFQFNFLT